MQILRSLLNRILRVCHFVSCVPLMILVAITTLDVIARYAFASSVPDTAEISSIMLGLCISLALAPATKQGAQVRFDLILGLLPGGLRKFLEASMLLLAAGLFGLIGWQGIKRVTYSASIGEYAGALEIPLWPAKFVFAFGCLLTSVALISLFVSAIRERKRGDFH